MKTLYTTLLSAVLAFLCSCTDTEQFRVNGEIEGKPTMNLRINYYAHGALQSAVTAVREGKFEFFCNSPQHTLVEICDNEYRPLARLYAANGETFNLNINRDKPYNIKIEGNNVSQRWADFLNSKADSLAMDKDAANSVIASYIAAHPDDVLSTLLLVTAYNASASAHDADSLLSLITPEARPSVLTDGYSLILQRLVSADILARVHNIRYVDNKNRRDTFNIKDKPLSVLVFNNSDSRAQLKSTLAQIDDVKSKHKPNIIDLLMTAREFTSQRDTVSWVRGEVPGGLSSPQVDSLAIPVLPYFIVCDSAGRQLLRTPAAERLTQFVDSIISSR